MRDPTATAEDLADRLRLALEAGRLGTFRWDLASGTVTWDETLERLFGLEPGTFPGTFDAWVALLHPDDRDEVLATVDRAVAERGEYRIEDRVIWPDGTVRWLQGRGKVTLGPDGEVTGTIGVSVDITDRKGAEQRAEAEARALAAAVEGERLQRTRLEFLSGLTTSSLATDHHRELMEAVTRAAVPMLGDWCSLHFQPEPTAAPDVAVAHVDPDRVAWFTEVAERFPYDPDAPTGVPRVIRTGEVEFVPEVTPDVVEAVLADAPSGTDRDEARAVLDALGLTSVITVPLRTDRGVLGAIRFVSAESGRRYDEDDLALARATAGRVAEMLERLWFSDQQRYIASTLQAALLPPGLPDIAGIELAARYWAAGAVDVGGDFFDVFSVDDDRWRVLIGDVCGTGSDAAALTSIARHTARAAARHGQDDAAVLHWMNDAVLDSDRDLFCTTCYASFERAGEAIRLQVTTGGHPLPVVAHPDGSTEEVGDHGTLLGVFRDVDACSGSATLAPGDVVVFHTDGATDVPPPAGLDPQGWADLVSRAAAGARNADSVADRIHAELAARLPIARREDDIALVVLRVQDG